MNETQRKQVCDNARYLQNVRPIDPDEIYEYVEGQPHPAVVRQFLREEAFSLGFIEREDGTFVPVSAEPVQSDKIACEGVERVPPAIIDRLNQLLTDRYGPDWETGDSGEQLRATTRAFKAAYLEQSEVEYDAQTALAYAIYHLPDYYATAQYLMAGLVRDGLIPHQLRILDVGAGVGGPLLGILDLLPEDCLIEYHAIEPSAAVEVLEPMLETAIDRNRNRSVTVHRETAEAFEPDREYNLLLFGNVLSELSEPVRIAERYLTYLAADGTCLMFAPADRNTAIQLRSIERKLADEEESEWTVYAPTVRLWPGRTPTDRGWTFDVKPDFAVPSIQQRLASEASDGGEFINVDVQFAFSVLRRDDRQRIEFTPDPSRFAPMADSERHVSDRIDLVGIKLSHDLAHDPKAAPSHDHNPLFKISDGSEGTDHYAVLTIETMLNRDLLEASYGDLLVFENALVLWNAEESAYNLVVDDESVVDVIVYP